MITENKILALINKLDKIAKKNGDEFVYRIDIEKNKFRFACEESTENHCFTDGVGFSIEEALNDAENFIKEACKRWGYKE